MSSMTYAGIGSRETPEGICALMTAIARDLQGRGYILRSGGAMGADRAFELGAAGRAEIYHPDDTDDRALALAKRFHPAWNRCSDYAKRLHARNGYQVLGRSLSSPSDFVVCWTKDGRASGGTGQALRIAAHYHIPIFNLHDATAHDRLVAWLGRHGVFA